MDGATFAASVAANTGHLNAVRHSPPGGLLGTPALSLVSTVAIHARWVGLRFKKLGCQSLVRGSTPRVLLLCKCEDHRRFIGLNRDYSCQMRRIDTQDIRVSEFSSGEHPPGILVCVKGHMLFGQWWQGNRFGWRRIDGPIAKDAQQLNRIFRKS